MKYGRQKIIDFLPAFCIEIMQDKPAGEVEEDVCIRKFADK